MIFLVIFLLFVCVNSFVYVENNRFMKDGNELYFHGIAVDTIGLFASSTLNKTKMIENGFNVQRRAFTWENYEIQPNKWNETYMDLIEKEVNDFGRAGIFTILDMHQDVLSKIYCNSHGFPSFYSYPYNDSRYTGNGSRAFPEPIAKPVSLIGEKEACKDINKYGWFFAYLTYSVSSVFQRLYDNEDFFLTRFGDFWEKIALRFKDNPFVLGYELLNEPWLGDIYKNIEFVYPPYAEKNNLVKLYSYLTQRIRNVDTNHIIFFQPVLGGNFEDLFNTGFDSNPVGENSVFSYHIYCPVFQADVHHTHPNIISYGICNIDNLEFLKLRYNDTIKLQSAGFLTEFGAYYEYSKYPVELMRNIFDNLDLYGHSWTYWAGFPDNKTLLRELSRTYALYVGGKVIDTYFNSELSEYYLKYTSNGNPSVIYINRNLRYINGINISYSDCSKVIFSKDLQYIKIDGSLCNGTDIKVIINPY